VLAIILFAPMLLEKLRIPSIVGMIFAGLLIGPHGLHVLERDGSFELFGKVGLYYIMFLASLEMNLQDVARIKLRAGALGLLGFIIPMVIGYAANTFILGYGVAAAVLIAAMYASHTLVAYPIVLRYGLSRIRSVSIAVGGTIVADTLTLLVLAVVGGMYKEQGSGLMWIWLVAKVVVLGLLIIYAFPRIGRWFFRRYSDSVVQYVFVLALVFLGAGMMEFVGMEGILGAFLVGIVLNRLIPPTSPLMSHIEFVGNALFIPYFLIGVGMLINLRALIEHEGAIIVAAVMVIVGMLGKWLAALATQKLFRMTREERRLMFGLTGSRAAATLAVVLVGYQITTASGEHLLGDDVLNGAMVLILVTCVASSLVTENTARRMAERKRALTEKAEDTGNASELETEIEDHKDRLMVALKDKEQVSALINLALLIRTPHSPASIVALNVVLEDEPQARKPGLELLERAEKIAAATGVKVQSYSRWSVNLVSGISHAAKENAVSDLIMGLHRKEKLTESFYGRLSASLLGAVDHQVLIFRAVQPLSTVHHLHVLVPHHAELEQGFARWMARVANLAQQISCSVTFYSTPQTTASIQHFAENGRANWKSLTTNVREYISWNDLLPLAHDIPAGHMAIFICARRGTISHQAYLDRLPDQIERYFSARNVLIVFPLQPASQSVATSAMRSGVPQGVK